MLKSVIVEWLDIIGDDEWRPQAEAELIEPQRFVTLGYMLRNDDKAVVVCSTYSHDDDTVGSVTSIPKGAVTRVRHVTIEPILGTDGA